MCFLGTTTGVTSCVDGDEIQYDKDMGTYIVRDKGEIVGIFDLSAIEYLFLANKKKELKNELR